MGRHRQNLRSGNVAAECRRGFLFSDEARWLALGRIQEEALKVMREAGRIDREEARRLALRDDRVSYEGEIVLVGLVEIPGVVRRMLGLMGMISSSWTLRLLMARWRRL